MNPNLHGPVSRPRRAAAALRHHHRLWRFLVVGLGGAGVNSLFLFLLHGAARMPLFAASVLATEAAVGHNYLLNEAWTFGSRRPSIQRFLKFNLTAVAALLLNATVVSI